MADTDADVERFRRDFSLRLESFSVRQIAAKSGWGRTTVYELKSGRRQPTEDQLEHLLTAVGAESDEIEDWRHRLSSLQPVVPAEASSFPQAGQAHEPAPELVATFGSFLVSRVWLPVGVVLLAAVLFSAGVLVGRTTAPRPPRSADAVAMIARVANTDGLGVDLYSGPSRKAGSVGAVAEGDDLAIVCQDGGGEPITDRVGGRRLTWPVWDRLLDRTWVPDLYTSTSKTYSPGPGRTALVSC